jgi:hypothetical protein
MLVQRAGRRAGAIAWFIISGLALPVTGFASTDWEAFRELVGRAEAEGRIAVIEYLRASD